jgi:hypothetical protein
MIFACFLYSCGDKNNKQFTTWGIYRGDEGSNAFSGLNQINTENVGS